MTVVVTMAGAGERFRNKGYQVPKHMIRARGKTLFEWSLESLKNFSDQHFIFACLDGHDASWIKRTAADLGFRNATVVFRPSLSLGQAQTAYDVLSEADPKEALWVFNIDTYIKNGISPRDIHGCQGCVHVFNSRNPAMSFVRFSDEGYVLELAEKNVISNWATVGVYGFETANLFRNLYDAGYQVGQVQEVGGERYVAPMYQLLLNEGGKICAPKLKLADVYILGTPMELLEFDPLASPPFGSQVVEIQ